MKRSHMNLQLQRKGAKFADTIIDLFQSEDSFRITLDDDFRDNAIQALEDRGCVVQRELHSEQITVYVLPNLCARSA